MLNNKWWITDFSLIWYSGGIKGTISLHEKCQPISEKPSFSTHNSHGQWLMFGKLLLPS